MKLSSFCHINQLSQAARAGFDDVELDICELAAMEEEEFNAFYTEAEQTEFSFEVCSDVIPLTVRFHSPDFDAAYWLRHVRLGAERTARLGARRWTFGAGKCRSIPDGYPDPQGAVRRVEEFVGAVCDVLSPYGISLLVEPLGPANSNFIQTIGEAVEFIKRVDRKNLGTMCDLRHMYKMEEPFSDIRKYHEWIWHAHIDNPVGIRRLFPRKSDGYEGCEEYIGTLIRAGCDGILAIEALDCGDFLSEARESVEYLKEIINRQYQEAADGNKS